MGLLMTACLAGEDRHPPGPAMALGRSRLAQRVAGARLHILDAKHERSDLDFRIGCKLLSFLFPPGEDPGFFILIHLCSVIYVFPVLLGSEARNSKVTRSHLKAGDTAVPVVAVCSFRKGRRVVFPFQRGFEVLMRCLGPCSLLVPFSTRSPLRSTSAAPASASRLRLGGTPGAGAAKPHGHRAAVGRARCVRGTSRWWAPTWRQEVCD